MFKVGYQDSIEKYEYITLAVHTKNNKDYAFVNVLDSTGEDLSDLYLVLVNDNGKKKILDDEKLIRELTEVFKKKIYKQSQKIMGG